jgi:competence ComEA-like helix-hairpin-helix protein
MSNLLKYRGTIILLSLIFGLSLYWSIASSKETVEPVAVVSKPAVDELEKPKPKFNNVIEFRISDKLKINSASVEDIYSRLKGIGPKTAQAIVDYRDQFGPFENLEQLMDVKGIGPATIRDIEQQIVFSLPVVEDVQ